LGKRILLLLRICLSVSLPPSPCCFFSLTRDVLRVRCRSCSATVYILGDVVNLCAVLVRHDASLRGACVGPEYHPVPVDHTADRRASLLGDRGLVASGGQEGISGRREGGAEREKGGRGGKERESDRRERRERERSEEPREREAESPPQQQEKEG
jgi:hypothetical protein